MIKISDLNFGYRGVPLFSELQLELKEGSIYGLLGKNGAGKTSLLKLLCGLIFQQSGSCEVLGSRPAERSPSLLEQIYLIPEEFFIPSVNAAQYKKLYAPFYPKFDDNFYKTCLKEFDISMTKPLQTLSYGQKKKFLIAFGLSTNCRLLLFDEPTNGLDIPSKSQFRKMVAGALTEDKTFIISTHQVRDIENLIDPIIILDEGKIIFNEAVGDISKKLLFEYHHALPKDVMPLYAEKTLQGYLTVEANKTGHESDIHIEALFNAVISNKEMMNRLFRG